MLLVTSNPQKDNSKFYIDDRLIEGIAAIDLKVDRHVYSKPGRRSIVGNPTSCSLDICFLDGHIENYKCRNVDIDDNVVRFWT